MARPPRKQSGPDRDAALAQYRRRAGVYDLELALFEPLRRDAVAALALAGGEVVIDVGCGTGLSLPLLRAAVGERGRVVGIEQSPQMIERARERVREARWRNVTLLRAAVEDAAIPGVADAALFHLTHDVLRRPEAVAQVLRRLRPGGRVVACGLKWARGAAIFANAFVLPAALHSVSTLEGLAAPWSHLAPHLEDFEVRERLLGCVYLARGRLASRRRGGATRLTRCGGTR